MSTRSRLASGVIGLLLLLALSLSPRVALAVAPPNDLCAGAELIPAAGPFPYLTAVTADITDATVAGDPPVPSCQASVARSIWYKFTPSASGNYTISTCADAPTGSTVDDTVLSLYTSSDSTCAGVITQVAGACDDDSCTNKNLQSVLTANLTAGTTYYILVHQYGPSGVPTAGNTAIQLRLTQLLPPSNDICSSPTPLPLNTTVNGTLALANNNFQMAAASACFTLPAAPAQVGQTATTATGRDVVYSFTAPSAGNFSFRATATSTGGDLVVVTSQTCPAGAGPNTIVTPDCLGASNRNANTSAQTASEEVMCVPLAAGQNVFVFVDEVTSSAAGGSFTIEATPCSRETEPNNTPATPNFPVCGLEGSISPTGDVDYVTLGVPAAGSRIFAMADGVAGNSNDFDMRITTATDTLEYDDSGNSPPWGSLAPNIAGRPLAGLPAFLRMNHFSSLTAAEPYRLYGTLQAPGAGLGGSSATAETEPNNTIANASSAANLFFSGTIPAPGGGAGDVDLFKFCAESGDTIFLSIDGDPLRDLTPFNPTIALFDKTGASVFGTQDDGGAASNNTLTAGILTATTPTAPSEAAVYRATYSGAYYAQVKSSGAVAAGTSVDYLYSIALNCLPGTQLTSDLAITMSDAPDPATTNQNIDYLVTVNNLGPKTALDATWTDTLPAGLTYVGVSAPPGWACAFNAGTVACTTSCLVPNNPQVFTLTTKTNYCIGNTTVSNTAMVFSKTAEVNGADNMATAVTTVNDPGTCNDGDACTQSDVCQAGACVGTSPVVCSPSDQCHVAGVCNPGTGACSNPVAADGTGCSDGDGCTQTDVCQAGACVGSNPKTCVAQDQCHVAGVCNPASGTCSNPPAVDGTACDDNSACTLSDSCQSGTCTGANPVLCSASDQCHVAGVCDPATGVCSNPAASDGTACSDGNPCTTSDTCQVGVCASGSPFVCVAQDQCHLPGVCNPADGTCSNPVAPNGTACGAGLACLGGACNGCSNANQCGVPANPCLDPTCIAGLCGTTNKADNAPCSDGDACTQTDTCLAGTCTGANPVVCAASDQCHVAGSCDPATGVCSNPNKADGSACSDGDSCTQTDTCQTGTCTGANPVVCAASDQCHVAGSCDPATGVCSNPSKADGSACSDGDSCTQTDTCQAGACTGANPVVCSASDQCHVAGVCSPATGVCSNPSKADGTACNDGSACTQSDTCQAGTCTGANPVVCSPQDQCHVAGVCDPANGTCSNPAAADGTACIDGDSCTQSDTCQAGTCTGANPVVCSPQDQCHVAGVCDPANGTCSNPAKADGTACSDSDACTQSDTCQAGTCTGANPVVCSAQDQCHVAGVCDPASGACSNPAIADGTACNDNSACTQSDTCQAGTCTGANPVVCAAQDQCHVAGVCDPANGTCSNPAAADGTACNDGSACTQSDTCQSGACTGANPVVCSALDQCHVAGSCDPATGACSNPNALDGAACDDNSACTQTDACSNGACVGSNPVVCPPPDACHAAGTCDAATGTCSYTLVGADGDADGAGDACDNCPLLANADQKDTDADGVGDACDNCASDINGNQADLDGDGIGDACDPDIDGDGITNVIETMNAMDPLNKDSDGDNIDDCTESCDQNDGSCLNNGVCTFDKPADTDGDSTIDALDDDSDNDGLLDVDEAGDADLATPPVDSDNDGVPDYRDVVGGMGGMGGMGGAGGMGATGGMGGMTGMGGMAGMGGKSGAGGSGGEGGATDRGGYYPSGNGCAARSGNGGSSEGAFLIVALGALVTALRRRRSTQSARR